MGDKFIHLLSRLRSKDTDNAKRLLRAVEGNHMDLVIALLSAGTDVNEMYKGYGYSALVTAASKGHLDMSRTLLAEGVNIDVVDIDGWSALHWAASMDYIDVHALLDVGADIDERNDYGSTPITAASSGWRALYYCTIFAHKRSDYRFKEL